MTAVSRGTTRRFYVPTVVHGDIGYPKAATATDGTVIVFYYDNAGEGLERLIAASRIEVPSEIQASGSPT